MSSTNRSSRKHKSTRIPGVVMRPAPPPQAETSSAAAARERQRIADEEDQEHYRRLTDRPEEEAGEAMHRDDPGADLAKGNKPMRNVKLCLSGCSEERYQLRSMIEALGGSFTADLTRDTTHLLAATPGSPKWYSARQHGMHVLHPKWLHEVSERYRNDQDLELNMLTEKHRLRPLESFRILLCLPKFEDKDHDPKRFQTLRARFEQLGAQCVQFSLDPGGITHVVCPQDALSGSSASHPKAVIALRRWAASQPGSNFGRGVDNVKIEEQRELASKLLQGMVWLEWMEDCEAVDDYLAPTLYQAETTRPASRETRLKAAWSSLAQFRDPVHADVAAVHSTKRSTRGASEAGTASSKTSHPKIRTLISTITASKEHSRSPASVADGDHTVDQNVPLKPLSQGDRDEGSMSHLGRPRRVVQVQSDVKQHGKTSQRVIEECMTDANARTDLKAGDEEEAVPLEDPQIQAGGVEQPAVLAENAAAKLLFQGLCIALDDSLDEDVIAKIGAHIQEHGGRVASSSESDTLYDYYIAPLKGSSSITAPNEKLVTHLWLERSTYEERVIDPSDIQFVGMTPTLPGLSLPLPGAERISLLLSGHTPDSPDNHHIRTVARALGISVSESAKRSEFTHLLCVTDRAREGPKAQKAREWGKPIVGLEFLRKALYEGIFEPPAPSALSLSQEKQKRTRSGSSTVAESLASGVSQRLTVDLPSRSSSSRRKGSFAYPSDSTTVAAPGVAGLKRKASLLSGAPDLPNKRTSEPKSTPPRASPTTDQSLQASEHVGDGFSLAAQITADEVFAMLDARRASPTPMGREVGMASGAVGRRKARPDRLRGARSAMTTSDRGSSPAVVQAPPLIADAQKEAERLLRERREADARLEGSYTGGAGALDGMEDAEMAGGRGAMRITYDDPTERRERARLMKLVEKAGKQKEVERELARREQERSKSVAAAASAGVGSASVSPEKRVGGDKSPSKSPRKDHFGEGRQWSKEALAARRAQEDWSKVKARRQPGTASKR